MRILSVTILKNIQLGPDQHVYFNNGLTKLILDKKSPSNRKMHQLSYQQNPRSYGTVGDCTDYLDNEELLALEEKGMIRINKTK